MTTLKTERPSVARAMVIVEWMFLRVALAALIGVLPFALASINTTGKVLAVCWGLIYAMIVVASWRVNAGLIWDAIRVLARRDPIFTPSFEREYEENKDKIEQARAVIPRPILFLLDFLQLMNPLALTAMVASLYVRARQRTWLPQPTKEARLGRSDVWALDETRRVARRLDLRELMPVG